MKAQKKNNKMKRKLHTDNRNKNDCRFQLYWKNSEWVSPRSDIVRKNLLKFFKQLYIEKIIEKLIRLDIHY